MTLPDFHAVALDADDGVRLALTCVGRPGAAATLVYVHPLLAERRFWSPVIRRLHEHLSGAVAQISYDQRGHGDSAAPGGREPMTVARLADDLDLVLGQASGSVVLVAHSTAAQLVCAYAAAHRDRAASLAGLVFLNAAAEPPSFPRYLRTWPPRLARWRRHRALDAVTAAGEAVLGYRIQRSGPLLVARSGADPRTVVDVLAAHPGLGLPDEAAEHLRHIPAVVLAGERDPLAPPQRAVALANALRADFDIVTDAGHFLPHTHLERATDTITATLDHALRRHLEHPSRPGSPTPDTARHKPWWARP